MPGKEDDEAVRPSEGSPFSESDEDDEECAMLYFRKAQERPGSKEASFKRPAQEADGHMNTTHGDEFSFTALRGMALFANLSDAELRCAATKLTPVSFKAGDYLIRQGNNGTDLYILKSGVAFAQLKVQTEIGETETWKEVMEYKSGGFFGERALLQSEPRAASIIARTDVEVLRLHQAQYKELLAVRCQRLRGNKLFQTMGEEDIEAAARMLLVESFEPGEHIIRQGDRGADLFILDSGEAFAQILLGEEWKEVMQYEAGGSFGERALLREEPRAASVLARTAVTAFKLSGANFKEMLDMRNLREGLTRNAKLFETLSEDQVAKVAALLIRRVYYKHSLIVSEGEHGEHCFILEEGECVASIRQPDGSQQDVLTYGPGALFGEKALMQKTVRGASIRVTSGTATCWMLSRSDFEGKLGPMSNLKAEAYLSDPRKLIADFYTPGTTEWPGGALPGGPQAGDAPGASHWFAVYRPCSRDSIAKMLGKVGVGKGLNVKGKSAKKNRLSGFVPFCQVSNNDHKKDIEEAPEGARSHVYYRSQAARDQALGALRRVDASAEVALLEGYEGVFGLDLPEALLREAYLMRPDLSPMLGWETGRESEPGFLNMNLHSLRDHATAPRVCLLQYDQTDPMNPLGLLMAYAEEKVLPVVSDFDTFLIASKGGVLFDPLPEEQARVVLWSLGQTEQRMLENLALQAQGRGADVKSWTSWWLKMLEVEQYHPTIPPFGFGDAASVRMISKVVEEVKACGAVRHGAECFNYFFPQELDEEFLVVWEGLVATDGVPWKQHSEPELRAFLLERLQEGYSFPMNPTWAIRDPGWYEVWDALRRSEQGQPGKRTFECWFPPEVVDKIEAVRASIAMRAMQLAQE